VNFVMLPSPTGESRDRPRGLHVFITKPQCTYVVEGVLGLTILERLNRWRRCSNFHVDCSTGNFLEGSTARRTL
jgi:hypothetical protein